MRLPELFVYGVRMCYTKNEGERLLVKKVPLSLSNHSLKCSSQDCGSLLEPQKLAAPTVVNPSS